MKLKSGNLAPLFTVQDIFDNDINLHEYREKKTLISFFRNVACPFCTLRIHQLNKLRDSALKDLEMIFFFESQKENLLRSIFHQDMSPIPLISDPKHKIYTQFGVEISFVKAISTLFSKDFSAHRQAAKELGFDLIKPHQKEKTKNLIPADFLIDENLKIIDVHYGKSFNDHMDIQVIKDFASKKNPPEMKMVS